ncbi:hypothetical protein CANARDRAFT_174718 [[Candida] arabinofermentans NRRL YB-2248]|uniref:Uncharacterized protein n=1 Tax=[Candida] arabinofermentans NRRL YB-2248 TaxID=983967 RepID=A0A1E4T4I3_9ASCO|nr:hypothetical protein CANARDRAFT_174718 [[Candida] arabinofermentans NRRL YB-2248]
MKLNHSTANDETGSVSRPKHLQMLLRYNQARLLAYQGMFVGLNESAETSIQMPEIASVSTLRNMILNYML